MKISIIVPVYNAEDYLNRCVESLISQTFKDIEIILIDDGSSDNSLEICKSYANKDARVKVISQKNAGPSRARNVGLDIAKGDWILFVDSDDAVAKDICEILYNKAIETNADMVICNLTNIFNNLKQDLIPFLGDEKVFDNENIKKLERILITRKSETGASSLNITGPTSKLIRRMVIGEARFPEDMDLAEDACFFMTIYGKITKVIYISDVLYYRYLREESISNTYDKKYASRVSKYTNWVKTHYKNIDTMKDAVVFLELKNLIWIISGYMKKNNSITYNERVYYIKKYLEETQFDVGFRALYQAKLPILQSIMILLVKLRLYRVIDFFYKCKSR